MDRRIVVAGRPLKVFDAGRGPVLLFVHGFPLDHTMWQGQLDYFSKQYRCIAPDLQGFGGSPEVAQGSALSDYVDDLIGVLNELDITEPVILCGLSMGGYIALEFVRRDLGRLRGLVLCDTRAEADAPETQEARRAVAERALREGPEFLAAGMIDKLFATSSLTEQPELIEQTRRVILSTPPAGIAKASLAMAARRDSTSLVAEMELPTLILVGSEDSLTPPAMMRGLAHVIAEATFVEIAGAGHLAPLEAPEAVNQALEHFLIRLNQNCA